MFNSTCGRTDLSAHDAQQKGNQMDSQHADHRQPAERHQTGVKEKNELLIRTHLKLEAAMLSTVITSASPTAERKKGFLVITTVHLPFYSPKRQAAARPCHARRATVTANGRVMTEFMENPTLILHSQAYQEGHCTNS